jgi:hypothetical protein
MTGVSKRPTSLTQSKASLPRHSLTAQAVPPRSVRQSEPSLSVCPSRCAAHPKQNKPASPPELTDQKRLGQAVTSPTHLGFPEHRRSTAKPDSVRVSPAQLANPKCTALGRITGQIKVSHPQMMVPAMCPEIDSRTSRHGREMPARSQLTSSRKHVDGLATPLQPFDPAVVSAAAPAPQNPRAGNSKDTANGT